MVDLADHPDLFKEPTPALLVKYDGKMLEPFYAQFLSKDAYVVYVKSDGPKTGKNDPAHQVEASRDEHLMQLKDLDPFDTLLVRGDGITDAGLQQIGAFEQLRRLDIQSKNVTDEGVKSLAGLKNLESLSLSQTSVTNAGVAELRKALPKCKVQGPRRRSAGSPPPLPLP